MTSTFAYLDPGSGSFILQLTLGGVVALAATAKLYWRRILRFLRIRTDDPGAEGGPGPTSGSEARRAGR